jgi:hypothetical protein
VAAERRRDQHGDPRISWAGYQAITEYLDHAAPVRTRGDKAAARAERVVTGGVDLIKQKAFELLSG